MLLAAGAASAGTAIRAANNTAPADLLKDMETSKGNS
jgi:hypothetical protein